MVGWTILLAACGGEVPASPPACPEGEVASGAACVPDACGVGTWGNLPVDESTIYVAAGGTGDGTAEAPLGDLQAAADRAGAQGGGLVAVAAGAYEANLELDSTHDEVRIAGVCRERVRVVGRPDVERAVVEIAGRARKPDIALSGMSFEGGQRGGLGVAIARVTLEDIAVRQNLAGGVYALGGAIVSLSNAVIEENAWMGLLAVEVGTRVTLVDVSVTDTVPDASGGLGSGIEVDFSAEAVLERVTVARNVGLGVRSSGHAVVQATDLTIVDTRLNPEGTSGIGVVAALAGQFSCRGCVVEGSFQGGILASDEGTTIDLVDTRISDTRVRSDGGYGNGLSGYNGAEVRGSGVTVERSEQLGVYAADAATIALTSSEIVDTNVSGANRSGAGVAVRNGATVELTDVALRRNGRVGVLVSEDGSVFRAENLRIEDTPVSIDAAHSTAGIYVTNGARARVTGAEIVRSGDIAASVEGAGSRLRIEDSHVADVPMNAAGSLGWGLLASLGARLEVVDSVVERASGVGVAVREPTTSGDFDGLRVLDTRRARATRSAIGLLVDGSASVDVRASEIRGTAGPGLAMYSRAFAFVTDSTISANTFAGVVAAIGSLRLEGVTLEENAPDPALGGGVGVYASSEGDPAFTVQVLESTIGPHPYAAAWFAGPGAFRVVSSDLSGSAGVQVGGWPAHGNAVYARGGVGAWDGERGLLLDSNTFHDAERVAVLLDGASATLEGTRWRRNATDVHQQRCGPLPRVEGGAEGWSLCEGGALVTDDSMTLGTFRVPEVSVGE